MIVGSTRLEQDLREQGYDRACIISDGSTSYVLLAEFEIPAGSFAGRIIDLAIPAPNDYPRACLSAIHIRSNPHLVPFVPVEGLRNAIPSALGPEWQYWSYSFHVRASNTTLELMSQINAVFRKN